jgi:hypothetical protein
MIKIQIFILFFLLKNCSSIDVAVTANRSQIDSLKKLAVMEFESKDRSRAGDFSDTLSHQILKQTKFKIVERDKSTIKDILSEQALSKSGIVDENTAAKVGKVLGVDSIIIGKVEVLKNIEKSNYCLNTFNIKVISVETGNIFINVVKEPGIEWTPWIRTKYSLGLFGLIWDKNDLLEETCKINFLAERAIKEVQAEIDRLHLSP